MRNNEPTTEQLKEIGYDSYEAYAADMLSQISYQPTEEDLADANAAHFQMEAKLFTDILPF